MGTPAWVSLCGFLMSIVALILVVAAPEVDAVRAILLVFACCLFLAHTVAFIRTEREWVLGTGMVIGGVTLQAGTNVTLTKNARDRSLTVSVVGIEPAGAAGPTGENDGLHS